MQTESPLSQTVKEKWLAEGKNVNVDHLTTLVNSQTKIPLKILRVNQLDAVILDQELNEILKYQFNKIFSLFPRILEYTPELSFILELTVFYCSVWRIGTTYGNKLQNLKLDFPDDPTYRKIKLIGYALLHVIFPYLISRLSITTQSWFGLPNDNPRKKLWYLMTKLESIWKYFVFANLLVFLWNGKYSSIENRLLNLRLVYMNTSARSVSFEYMTRQLIWNGFSEFMIFIMRMFHSSSLQNFFQGLLPATS